ncbi:MAG: hypothetical protein BWK79_11250 [Beggiatoa sp. IS2]|nr:MAG: hypothetical protein BWK79_11250 [Beggiatoa sp. IS2]
MDTTDHSLEQIQTFWQQGEFEQMIRQGQENLTLENLDITDRVDLLIQLANAYQALGLSKQAYTTLLQAEQLTLDPQFNAQLTANATRLATLFTSLSDLSLATRQEIQARYYVDKSLAILPLNALSSIKAIVLNNLGNVLTVEAYYTKAVDSYSDCITLAKQANMGDLIVKALTNMAHAYFRNNQFQSAADILYQVWQQLEPMTDNYTKAFSLISLGELAQRLQRKSPFPIYPKIDKADSFFVKLADDTEEKSESFTNPDLRFLSNTALRTALSIARKLKNNRLLSYSYGYLGQLYETEQRYPESLQLTRQAIFFAQQNNALEILYRWQWQLGRLLKTQGQLKEAIETYQNAVKSLQPIRQELTIGYRYSAQPFREMVGPIYFELADLLLQQATNAVDKNHWLDEARSTIEYLKTAELQDYFQDECLPTPSKSNLLQQIKRERTAIFYPILLPDRTEILLSLPEEIQRFTVEISASQLEEEVNEFRFELEDRETTRFMEYAVRLYTQLIKPLENVLTRQKIDTLVIVPDGALRTIPFAALHDGKQFLIARYAIATTPGLLLTESSATAKDETNLLIGGLSKSVQGFTALANVRKETQVINQLYHQKATILLDEQFTMKAFSRKLSDNNYSMVHIASHGQFDSDPRKTFLLMYDDKLTINRLEQLIRRTDPIELLTLSACQTAVGDDQAALGLAGIALKAGARSALASLWFVEDEATTQLISEFYQQLHNHQLSKAKALQNAQKYLLAQPRYRHPSLWASFLLIGNWL